MKDKLIWLVLPLAVLLVASVGLVRADRDGYEDDDYRERGFLSRWFKPEYTAVESEQDRLYREECGGCHFPFQAGFLPAASWQGIMQGLDDHFGDNAELSPRNSELITRYLSDNSADRVGRERSDRVMWSIRNNPQPERITETAFFRHEHREIPPAMLRQTEQEISFVNCDSCHTQALRGSYNEHEIRIPGIGRWDD